MIRLSDKVRLIFAILGASSMLVSMYLIPFIKTEDKDWELFLFILVCPITSPIIGLVDMLRYNKNNKK